MSEQNADYVRQLEAEIQRLHKALGEQTDIARRWKNRANDLRRRRSQMLKRLGFAVYDDDSVVHDSSGAS